MARKRGTRKYPGSVREIMRRDFVTVAQHESLSEALHIMRMARLRHLLVVRDGILQGVLSYRDLQDRALNAMADEGAAAGGAAAPPPAVSEAMMASPYVLSPDATLEEAASRLARLPVGCLPVVERGPDGPRLVGLVTESDLLRLAFAAG